MDGNTKWMFILWFVVNVSSNLKRIFEQGYITSEQVLFFALFSMAFFVVIRIIVLFFD